MSSFAAVKWLPVQNKEGRYKAAFPGVVAEKTRIINSPAGEIKMYVNLLDIGAVDNENRIYMVAYADYPDNIINSGMRAGKVDTFLRNAILGSIESIKGKITKEEKIAFKKYPGKHTIVSFQGGKGIMDMKVFLVKNRIYIAEVGYETNYGNKTSLAKFFNAFEILTAH